MDGRTSAYGRGNNMNRFDLPKNLLAGLKRYAEEGIPTGGFLRAVLENNLKEAFARADGHSEPRMAEIVSYVYNDMPAACQGSPEKVDAWIEMHRKRREEADGSPKDQVPATTVEGVSGVEAGSTETEGT